MLKHFCQDSRKEDCFSAKNDVVLKIFAVTAIAFCTFII